MSKYGFTKKKLPVEENYQSSNKEYSITKQMPNSTGSWSVSFEINKSLFRQSNIVPLCYLSNDFFRFFESSLWNQPPWWFRNQPITEKNQTTNKLQSTNM